MRAATAISMMRIMVCRSGCQQSQRTGKGLKRTRFVFPVRDGTYHATVDIPPVQSIQDSALCGGDHGDERQPAEPVYGCRDQGERFPPWGLREPGRRITRRYDANLEKARTGRVGFQADRQLAESSGFCWNGGKVEARTGLEEDGRG